MTARAATVEARLRRLGADAGAALVADLWSARGFETTREGHTVRATAGAETVTLFVGRPGAAAGLGRPVDTVVHLGRGRPDAAGDGVRVLDAADVAEMLLYAVDREVATALCRRHFGAGLAELSPPRRDRIAGRVRALASRSPGAWVAVVAAFVLVGAAGAGLLFAPGAAGPAGPADAPAAVATPAAVPETITESAAARATGVESVPGLSAGGVTDPAALAAAHEAGLENLSYTAWVDFYRPRGGIPNATRIQRDVDMTVSGDRFLVEATVENGSTRTPVLTLYGDGEHRYVAEVVDGTTQYRRLAGPERPPTVVPAPATLRRTVVTRYLATPETSLDGEVRGAGRQRYRVSGRGLPPALEGSGVHNYSVVALIDSRGVVRDLAAEATVGSGPNAYRVRFEVTYDRLGRTTVTAPGWYEREFAGVTPTPAA
jgi:hypothetical protein